MTAVEAVDLKEHRPRFSRRRAAAAGGCAVYVYMCGGLWSLYSLALQPHFEEEEDRGCRERSKGEERPFFEAANSLTASQPQLPLPLHWRAARHRAGGAAAVHCGSTSGCEIVNTLLSWGVLALKAEERLRKGRGC